MVTAPLRKNGCQRADVVFDTCMSLSIKTGEQEKSGASEGLAMKIHELSTKLLKQWVMYISNINNKIIFMPFQLKYRVIMVETILCKTNNLSYQWLQEWLKVCDCCWSFALP